MELSPISNSTFQMKSNFRVVSDLHIRYGCLTNSREIQVEGKIQNADERSIINILDTSQHFFEALQVNISLPRILVRLPASH